MQKQAALTANNEHHTVSRNDLTGAAVPPEYDRLLSAGELLRQHLPVSQGTLANWRRRKLIPFIKLPGTNRVLFHWPSVQEALKRQQTACEINGHELVTA